MGDKFNLNDPERFVSIQEVPDDNTGQIQNCSDTPMSQQKTYRNLLEISCFYCHFPLVEWLVKIQGASVNYDGNLLLLFHLMMGYERGIDGEAPRILPFLIGCGVDPNKTSKNLSHAAPGGTFIHFAVALGSYLTIRYILQYVIQTNRGNTIIDLYKLSDPIPNAKILITPKTALFAAATHKDLKKISDGKLGQHYKVLEQFFLLGVVFSSKEIEHLLNYYKGDTESLGIIYGLIDKFIRQYDKEANPETPQNDLASSPSKLVSLNLFSNSKSKGLQLKTFTQWEILKKEEQESAIKQDEIWMFKLNIKKPVMTKPPLERTDSSLAKLKNMLFSPSGSPRSPQATSTGSPKSSQATTSDSPRRTISADLHQHLKIALVR